MSRTRRLACCSGDSGLRYLLVAAGAIEKTEQEYKTICRLLKNMRLEDRIPFDWIADNTRWMRKSHTFDTIETALRLSIVPRCQAMLLGGPVANFTVWGVSVDRENDASR